MRRSDKNDAVHGKKNLTGKCGKFVSTLWLKTPDHYEVFKSLQQILTNINNFLYMESTKSL